MSRRSNRLWWFEVDDIWGYRDRECPVVMGSVLLDGYNAGTWNIMDMRSHTMVGGWHAKRLGEATGEWAEHPNPEWLTPLGKIQALAEDHPERIDAEQLIAKAMEQAS